MITDHKKHKEMVRMKSSTMCWVPRASVVMSVLPKVSVHLIPSLYIADPTSTLDNVLNAS